MFASVSLNTRSTNYCNLILIKEEDATRFIPEDLDNGNLAAF